MEMAELSRAEWRRSSYSGTNGNCVEVAADCGMRVLVRDTKDHEGAVLAFQSVVWRRFAGKVKSGT